MSDLNDVQQGELGYATLERMNANSAEAAARWDSGRSPRFWEDEVDRDDGGLDFRVLDMAEGGRAVFVSQSYAETAQEKDRLNGGEAEQAIKRATVEAIRRGPLQG
jgi:hypothetical protein